MADISEKVLFPERGVKTELGKVYHPYGFGSTRPRNMMPASVVVTEDPTAAANIARNTQHKAKIVDLHSKVLAKQEEIAKARLARRYIVLAPLSEF